MGRLNNRMSMTDDELLESLGIAEANQEVEYRPTEDELIDYDLGGYTEQEMQDENDLRRMDV